MKKKLTISLVLILVMAAVLSITAHAADLPQAVQNGGTTILLAAAGKVKDSITLEKVDKEPAIYVLPEVNERAEGVANWFKMAGDLDLKAPTEFPEGKYNIKDPMEELYKCPEAFEIVSTAMKLATGMPVEPGNGMWEMVKKMSPETTAGMVGSMIPDGFLESLNAKLIRFDKV